MQTKQLLSIIVLGCFLLSLTIPAAAQENWQIQGNSLTTLKTNKVNLPNQLSKSAFLFVAKANAKIPSLKTAIINPLHADTQPKGWSYQELGLFCKLEVKMEKAFKMPVKFRLGEVQYVEKMEGKKGYILPPPIER